MRLHWERPNIPQQQLPDSTVQEILVWRSILNPWRTHRQEVEEWLSSNAGLINSPEYYDHIRALRRGLSLITS